MEAYESLFNPDYYFETILDGSLDVQLKVETRQPYHDTQIRYKEYFEGLRPFVVDYYGYRRLEKGTGKHKNGKYKWSIRLQNMLYKKKGDPYSFLDLKMGTNTVLRSKDSTSYGKFSDRDKMTTSAEYGFRLIGF